MKSPQFKAGNMGVFNEKVSLSDLRKIDPISILGLYISQSLLFLGILLILLNNLNIIAPGSYFGAYNWVTVVVFFIGLFINFISIPFLYFSSLKNFIKESDFWDKETFWILPLFFFGTFFLYNSLIAPALALLILSIMTIASIHIKFIFKARKINMENEKGLYASREQYEVTLKYLSAYYILLLALLVSFDPLYQVFFWIRLHT
ncbi:MAG: hypothetical protein UR95_C0001G0005 [Parcubacteria group bacterium GW2011_GWC1_36_108]|nr:MAG: hypothetical protein UR95_C0001G0005 [Parcubacteria group bacterium GW2011_GWC1_36_108]HAR99490.1 hypothetical protein [Candidatus Moranbacteria bacterium]